MSALPASHYVLEDEYLSNPEFDHVEWVDGQIVERGVGNRIHIVIAGNCIYWLKDYFKGKAAPSIGPELHCRLIVNGRPRYRLPDVAVVMRELPDESLLEGGPDLAIEIKSPNETTASQLRKLDEYFANGTKLAWLIVPEEKSVFILAPGQPLRTAIAGETLDGGDLLPGFSIPVDSLFD